MKLRFLPFLFLPFLAKADESAGTTSLTEAMLSPGLWEKSLTEMHALYHSEGDDSEEAVELPPELLAKLKEDGIVINPGNFKSEKMEWLSVKQNGLRSEPGNFTLLDKKIGEVIMRGTPENLEKVRISLYNRGDDGVIKESEYEELLRSWKSLLDEHLQVRAKESRLKGIVPTEGHLWVKDDTGYLLEGSVSKSENRAEFLRLRIEPIVKGGRRKVIAQRTALPKNVRKSDNGDVYIDNIPMVDQGQKGYCVVSSIERVGLYFGLNVDQHELAQVAETDERGTTSEDMENAFKKITGKIHVRTIKVMDYDYKQTVRDVKAYNSEAKRQGAKIFEIDFDRQYVIAQGFWQRVDVDVFKTIKAKENKFDYFQSKIKEFIDRGIPICWTLNLGMFPEKGAGQMGGGHMRLIHGYNESTQEIFYTDSWGFGHEIKKMPAIEGWCMTMGMYAMVPTN